MIGICFVESRCHGCPFSWPFAAGAAGYFAYLFWWLLGIGQGHLALIDLPRRLCRLSQRATHWATRRQLTFDFSPHEFYTPLDVRFFFFVFCFLWPCLCGILITRPASRSLLFELRPVLCSWPKNVEGRLGSLDPAEPFIMHCTGFACTSGPSFFHSCSDECKHMLLSHIRSRSYTAGNCSLFMPHNDFKMGHSWNAIIQTYYYI